MHIYICIYIYIHVYIYMHMYILYVDMYFVHTHPRVDASTYVCVHIAWECISVQQSGLPRGNDPMEPARHKLVHAHACQ